MRWLVEVMTLGKTETESLLVDGASWQKALQVARERRGDSGPMSGFSIELSDDGCRAVDSASRLRYDVRRAPDDWAPAVPASVPAPPSTAVEAGAPAASLETPAGTAGPGLQGPGPAQAAAQPPRPMSQPPRASKRPSLSPGAAAVMLGPAPSVASAAAAPDVPRPIAESPHVAAVVTASPRADVGMGIASQIVFKREEDATEALPLTYREYVFLVPTGTGELAAEALLRTQLDLVRASLERAPAGKLVNLCVFDVAFQGKPSVRPLSTLMWKDWREEPVVEFPRRPGYKRTASPAPAEPAPRPKAVTPAPEQAFLLDTSRSAPSPAAVLPEPPVAAVPVRAPLVVPAPIATVAAVAVPEATPVETSTPAAPLAPAPAPAPAPSAPTPSPAPQRRARVRGEDLIADLFESMHELHFLRDAVEGGDFCLGLAMEKIPSQAGIVHLYDIDRREFLVTSARGVAASALLLHRHPEGEALLSSAMAKGRAIVLADATRGSVASVERYVALGGVRSLIVAPVVLSGRFLGAIEILNPLDGQPYTEAEGNALTYIAEQFAEFVEAHGIVTDPQRIGSRAR